MDANSTESFEKTDSNAMRELIDVADESTGVYSQHASESLTIHTGGLTAEYRPRGRSVDCREDPLLNWVNNQTDIRIKRLAVGSSFSRPDGKRKHPIVTLEVVNE